MALPPIRIVIQGAGVAETQAEIARLRAELERLGTAGDEAARGTNAAGGALDDLERGAAGASDASERLTARFERLRNIGAVITGIGAGALILSGHLREVAEEGNGVEARLESILKAQNRLGELDTQNNIVQDVTVRGHFDDDDQIRNAAVLLDSFSVSTAHMSELLEDAARQARTMGTDVSSVAQQLGTAYNSGNVGMLKKSGITVSDEEIQRIKDAYAISQKLGQQTFVDVLGPAIKANTAALEDSLTETQQASNDAARAFDDFQTTVGTGSAEAHAAIQSGVITPLLEIANAHPGLLKTAGGVLEIGGSVAAIGGPILGLAGQIGMARLGFAGMGTAAIAAFRSAAAAAIAAAPAIWAAIAPILPLVLAIAAGVLLVVGGLYLWAKADLDKAAADKKLGDKADLDYYNLETKNRDAGKRSTVNAGESFEDWKKRTQRGAENSEDAPDSSDPTALLDLKSQLDAAKGGAPAAPAMPTAPAMPGAADAAPGALPVGGAEFPVNSAGGSAARGVPDNDPYADQIRELTRQKRDLKGKSNAAARDALTAQIDDLRDSERSWKTAHSAQSKGDKEAQKHADKSAKSAAELDKIGIESDRDAQIGDLQEQLDAAKKEGDVAKIESLTSWIEMVKAGTARETAMREAANIQDSAERAEAQKVIAARFDAARDAAQRAGHKAGREALAGESEKFEKGVASIDKIHAQGQFDAQIGDLEDALQTAKDARDAAKIEALTRQIETAKAQKNLDQAMSDAELIQNASERDVAIAEAQARFDNEESAANRAARRARRDANKDGGKAHDDAIRFEFSMARAARPNLAAFGALGSGIDPGDRFAEADALRPDYLAQAMRPLDFASMVGRQRAPVASENGGSGRDHETPAFQVEAESYRQNARGNIEIQLKGGVLEVPIPRLGDLRGRVGGRR